MEMKFLSPVEYARMKGLSLGWVYSQIWLGALPAEKVDGRWRINPDAVAEQQKRESNETMDDSITPHLTEVKTAKEVVELYDLKGIESGGRTTADGR